ncbi:phosphoglycerate dehydrogenase [Methanogenium cariaci]|jgi:phosphoglycerate dehydrogenase-like enzyme
MNYKVLISCPHLQRTIENYLPLFEKNNIELVIPQIEQNLSEKELLEIIDQYDGVIAGDDVFSEQVLAKASKLKVISKWGIGLDAIDLEAAKRLGIQVSNTPNVFGDEVADLVIGYIIMLSRNMHHINSLVRKGCWKEAQIRGQSLRGKTLGVIGVGSIGRAVIERAKAMGMNLIGYDVYPISDAFINETGMIQTSLEELLINSDFISLNCNLTEDNKHMIGKTEFELMKNQVHIINTARGGLIDEKYLLEALHSGKVAGAALDVFECEPLPLENSLHEFNNCIFGAHNSSNTYEAVMRTNDLAIDNLMKGLKEEVSLRE